MNSWQQSLEFLGFPENSRKEITEILRNYLFIHGSYGKKSAVLINMLKNVADRCLVNEKTIYLKNTVELNMMTDPDYSDYYSEKKVKSKIQFYTTDGRRSLEA